MVVSSFVVFSIFTYYDRLSQYNTRDQDATLDRINIFLKDCNQPIVTNGSNLSNIIVGFPAKLIRDWLDLHFKQDDQLIGNIYYTRILPFALVQATISLSLLLGCVFLLGKLSNWKLKEDYFYYLLALSIVLNFPMLKGLSKVLKYDCLSLILGMMALLSYLLAKKLSNFCFFVAAIVSSALACIEKDTAVSVLFFIVLCESILACLAAESFSRLCSKLAGSLLIVASVFCLTVFATVPKLWTNPGELPAIFSSIPSYGISADPRLLLIAASIVSLLFVSKRHLVWIAGEIRPFLSLKLFFILITALFLFALVYQKNDIQWPRWPARINELESQGIFVGGNMARVAMTTLDKSSLLTQAKLLLAEGRLLIYFLPELLVLTLLIAPFLVGKIKYILDAKAIGMIAAFCILDLLVYAYLVTPIEAKYLSLVMFGLVLLSASLLAGVVKHLSERNVFAGSAIALLVVTSLIAPSYQNAPAHFGYMNVFRSRKAEDIGSINVEDYSFWTWMGWGETSYELMNFASQSSPGKNITVGFDYLPPLHCPRNVVMAHASDIENFDLSDIAEMDAYFKKLTNTGIDYVIISKNTANRALALNRLLKEKRNKAVHVDRQGGIDYGWLFRPSDLVSTEWRDR